MRARPPSIFLWTPEYLFSRISGETFPCSYSWSCRSRRLYSLSRRYYLFGQDSQRGLRDTTSLSVFAFAARERSSPQLGDATLNTRISKPTAYKTTPRYLYLWACLPSSSSLKISLNLVRPVISRATHHGMCGSAFGWTRSFSTDITLLYLQSTSVKKG